MYKIRWYLLAIALAGLHGSYGQEPRVAGLRADVVPVKTPAPALEGLLTDRQTAFIVHLLTDRVDPGKKCASSALVTDRTVSLPCPTPFQTQLPGQ